MTSAVPSVFAIDIKGFKKRMRAARQLSKDAHVDFMDGIFVRNKSPAIEELPSLKGTVVHLMTINPERYFKELAKKGCATVVIHYEVCADRIDKTMARAHERKMNCYIAIKPDTEVNVLFKLLSKADGFLIMSVDPGAEGQTIDKNVFARVKELRRLTSKPILVDGGVRLRNAARLKRAGASTLIVGSLVSKAINPGEIFADLRRIISD